MVLSLEKQSPHEVIRAVDAEFTKLKESHPDGLLVAEDIVAAAANPKSAMHPFFEWDDSEAAKEWRLVQARFLIRKVMISNPTDMNQPPVPKFVSLMEDRQREGGGYRDVVEVITDAGLRAQLEETAKRELIAWSKRHSILTHLCQPVLQAAGIDEPKPKKPKRAS